MKIHDPKGLNVCESYTVEDRSLQQTLFRIVVKLDGNPSRQEDLLQEALIHFWLEQIQTPGRTLSWYLQSCRFYLLNYLNQGRSVDSLKRRHLRSFLQEESEIDDQQESQLICEETSFQFVSAHDLTDVLCRGIKPSEELTLQRLTEGFGVQEIARELRVSHQAVSKHRQKLAALALQLGISPSSRRSHARPRRKTLSH